MAFAGERGDAPLFPDLEVSLVDMEEGLLRYGRSADPLGLEQISEGLTRDEVRDAIGEPADRRQVAGNPVWFYDFNLPFPRSDDVVVCQYKVQFDHWGRVSGYQWRRLLCEIMAENLARERTVEVERVVYRTLSTDVLFDFDSAVLRAEGQDTIREVAAGLQKEFIDPLVVIVGHTDRIGDPGYNQRLSERRADAVMDALLKNGFSRRDVVAQGRGEAEPVVFCEGDRATPALIACLSPNRRVEVQVLERGNDER
ncbi:OmpA family protein [Alkalilimnicola ehrlichii MLHE-1]|uniref:OmpA family protein n=1 Tax=Alkalilimnicola ehrlichii TaxID=351052 RepID=UPI000304F6B5